jgi:hypothetical protein
VVFGQFKVNHALTSFRRIQIWGLV